MGEEIERPGFWGNLAEGGIPQIILGPAGSALSRLIGAAAEIPVAWLEEQKQSIVDRKEAKTQMSRVLSDAAAQMAGGSAPIVHRAMEAMLNREIRRQKNKEAVALELLKELNREPPLKDSLGPTEEWLDRFERLAEDASSNNMRVLFGAILAGEVRRPGAISAVTLKMLTLLDERLAGEIEAAASRVVLGDRVLYHQEEGTKSPNYDALDEIGFLRIPGLLAGFVPDRDQNGKGTLAFGDEAISYVFSPGSRQPNFPYMPLTTAGQQLLSCIEVRPDLSFFVRLLRDAGAEVSLV